MKSIAERFQDLFSVKMKDESIQDFYLRTYKWLQQQPENNYSGNPNSSKNFTLAEVEAIAREAVANAHDTLEYHFFNDNWWAEKLKEWGK